MISSMRLIGETHFWSSEPFSANKDRVDEPVLFLT